MDKENPINKQATVESKSSLASPKSRSRLRLPKHHLHIGFGLLMVVLLVVVGYILIRPNHTSAPSAKTAEVSITKDGFVPTTIQAAVGTQITWMNTDNKPHQVAADPHPIHSSIPGFNSNELLNPKESLSFTFEKPGTYTYHDHLHPFELKGTVIVK